MYNVAEFLHTCIQSVINQSFKEFELILVDDGSTDGSGAICDSWIERDERVKVFHQENSGVSTARNKGLELSQGQKILFLDADDEILPGMFVDMMGRFDDEIDAVCCGYYNVHTDGGREKLAFEGGILSAEEFIPRCFDTTVYNPCVWNKIFRRSVLFTSETEHIEFPADITNGEDLVWIVKALSSCRRIACIENCYYLYKEREGSAMKGMLERLDERALTELTATKIAKDLCRDISAESYFLVSRRYLNLLFAKLKVADAEGDKRAQDFIYQMLKDMAAEFHPESKRDKMTLLKVRLILMLKALHVSRKAVLFVENKMSVRKAEG